jgi:hypothetical protein
MSQASESSYGANQQIARLGHARATIHSSLVGMTQISVRLSGAWIVHLASSRGVGLGIEHDAQTVQSRADGRAGPHAVFADAAREHQHVQTAQFDQQSAQVAADLGVEHVQAPVGPADCPPRPPAERRGCPC